jgi:predicted ATPase
MAWATIIQGWVLAAQGQPQQGIARMQQGLATLQATGGRLRLPYYLTLLAEAYASSAEPATGVRLLAEAFAGMQHTAERRWEAELCRLQGTVLLAHASAEPPTAEAYFHQALDVARRQQAKSWELRAATSLARLWQSQDKRAEARALLAPIYGWFTEGFDTADLQEARVLLEALES